MKYVNLTPHEIKFVKDGKVVKAVVPSGALARVSMKSELVKNMDDGIPVYVTNYGQVEGLPEPERNVVYIVSSLVAARVPDRLDVLVPYGFVRDEKGNIVGCQGLQKI